MRRNPFIPGKFGLKSRRDAIELAARYDGGSLTRLIQSQSFGKHYPPSSLHHSVVLP
jgi:hypothetical protein